MLHREVFVAQIMIYTMMKLFYSRFRMLYQLVLLIIERVNALTIYYINEIYFAKHKIIWNHFLPESLVLSEKFVSPNCTWLVIFLNIFIPGLSSSRVRITLLDSKSDDSVIICLDSSPTLDSKNWVILKIL